MVGEGISRCGGGGASKLKISTQPLPLFSYTTLDAIDEKLQPQCIVVRLLRTWEARNFKENNCLLSVNCFLVDEKNASIQISIHPRRVHKFRNKLKEGNIFSITAFDVKQNLNCYRLTDHPYKTYFNEHTALEDVNGDQYNIPHEYFCIRPFADLEIMVNKREHLPDVIAQVSCIRTSQKVDETTTPPKTSLNLTLTCTFDSGETGYISVWEKLARQLSEELVQLKDAPLLVIATGVNPRAVGGQIYLNATASTWIFFNLDNMITKDFRKSTYYKNTFLPTSVDGTAGSIPSDFQSIGQILAFVNDKGGNPKMFWCKAKVVDVILTSGWFFIACTRCSNKITKSGGKITCETCPTVPAVGVLRYRIEVIVEDDNDTSTFVIFEKAAEKLLKTTASDLAAKSAKAENDDFGDRVPLAIRDIVGRVLLFYVKVSEYNFTAIPEFSSL